MSLSLDENQMTGRPPAAGPRILPPASCSRRRRRFDVHYDAAAAFKATLLKVPWALEPRVLMAAMHTTMIRANMTAYSTAVGPSSRFKKSATKRVSFSMCHVPLFGRKPDDRATPGGGTTYPAARILFPTTTPLRCALRCGGRVQGDIAEGSLGVRTEQTDGRDAHHDDQGQHDGILHRG